MKDWTETCRSSVAAWECDVFAHLTIAYYFDRLADATAAMLAELGETAANWRTVLSSPPVATSRASLLSATQWIDPVCPTSGSVFRRQRSRR